MRAPLRPLLLSEADRAGIELDEAKIAKLETYWELLHRWNARVNLTALQLDPPAPAAVRRLIIEPLTAVGVLPSSAFGWIDAGSGGGSPAIPMKMCRPAGHLVMVESRQRRASFLRETVRVLGLPGADVKNARLELIAEELTMRSWADIVTARAIRLDDRFVGVIRGLLKSDGRLVYFGPAQHDVRTGLNLREQFPLGPGAGMLSVFALDV